MFGIKTLVVGGGAVAVLWMMHTNASAGDLVDNVKNGVNTVSQGASAVSQGYGNVQSFLNSGAGSGVLHADSGSGSNLSGPAVELQPSAARPGMQVLITVPSCIQPTQGTATSAVFANNGSVSLTRNPRGAGLAGTATIISNAQNGSWSVNVTCGTGANSLNGVTSITIFGGVNPTPTSPPKAGGGGSVMKGDVGMTAGGVALVAGGVGYGLWSLRRRNSASGTHVG